MAIGVKIEGLDRLIAKTDRALLAGPLGKFFQRAGILVSNRAKEKAPVDTGRLRSSIGYEVDSSDFPLWAKVGTNVEYAPYMEFGTGAMSDGEGASSWHWPPGQALDTWAARHGFQSGFQVARRIGLRGGLKPRRYMREAIAESLSEIKGLLKRLADEAREKWEAR